MCIRDRDVGRVMNIPYAEVDAVAKQVPAGPGALHITLVDALKPVSYTHLLPALYFGVPIVPSGGAWCNVLFN